MPTKPTQLIQSLSFLRRYLLSFPVLLILSLSIIVYIYFGKTSTQALVDQTHERQLHLASSGASTVTQFLKLSGSSLTNLAKTISTTDDNPEVHMRSFTETWKDTPLIATLLTDTQGTVRHRSRDTIDPSDLPSVANRKYFQWAKTAEEGKVYFDEPVIPVIGEKDEYIIPIATPVIKNGQFAGVLVLRLSLKKLAEQYLTLLKFTDSTRIYLIDSQGTLLYSPFPDLQGKNYIKYLEENPFPGSSFIKDDLLKRATSTAPGKAQIILPDMEKKSLSPFLIAHAPIILENQNWTLAVATPVRDAVAYVGPIYISQLGLLITTFLVLIFLGIRTARQHPLPK